ncbi:hypothetical protein B0H12DRAFT_794136 [Mycena haematopus]|nr:hypothetical protein B0H12DRAFT_794136 [Mycena haematopus]
MVEIRDPPAVTLSLCNCSVITCSSLRWSSSSFSRSWSVLHVFRFSGRSGERETLEVSNFGLVIAGNRDRGVTALALRNRSPSDPLLHAKEHRSFGPGVLDSPPTFAMNGNPSRPPLDNENGYDSYEQRSARQYHPQQARPTIQMSQMDLQRQPRPDQYQSQPALQRQPSRSDLPYSQPAVLQRQPSRPDLPYSQQTVLQRQPSRPDQPYPQQAVLQRQPSRPDQPYQAQQGRQQPLQRQPSRPDQPYQQQPQLRQPQPSRPDVYNPAMTQQYQYQEVPLQPVAPALMRMPSAPGSSYSASDSQTTLAAPIRPYAKSDAMLIRNNSDDELDKSDVFWRRFNASAAQQQLPDAEKSSWLEKYEGKRFQHSRILWIVGIIFVMLAVGGIGIGIYLSFKDNSNTTRPTTIGGAEDITSAAGLAATIAGGGGGGNGGGSTSTSSPHVTPTNTINDR